MNSLFSSKFWLAICLCLATISTANAGIFKTANWEGTTQFGTFQTIVDTVIKIKLNEGKNQKFFLILKPRKPPESIYASLQQ